ncbi:MAG: hypothetical protein FJX57_09180, partial [Alphaproteobacteria bacterium]|nr:hypothetical protein [Alphaproteobacteria bacterium]
MELLPDFLIDLVLGKPVWMWAVFLGLVLSVLVLDLGILHKDQQEIDVGESLRLSAFYFALAVAFGSWVLYVFGACLLGTGIKMLWMADKEESVGGNPVLAFLRKRLRVTDGLHGERFWIRRPDGETGKLVWYATPLFLCLVLVEAIDLIFAVDSVPAIFAITQDPFIVYTSNIFAILGLRALYFALAA